MSIANGLRGKGLVWLIGAVVCLLRQTAGPIARLSGHGRPHTVLRYY